MSKIYIGFSVSKDRRIRRRPSSPTPPTEDILDALLMESGAALLMENGRYIRLESVPAKVEAFKANVINDDYWNF